SVPGATPGASGSGSLPRGGFGDDDPLAPPARGEIVDPIAVQSADEVRVDLDGNFLGDTVGTSTGTGLRNLPFMSYRDRFVEYERRALESLDTLTVPPSLRNVVSTYFTELER
ncbi:MAG: hypothetical protein OEO77_15165, partial [Acidimicrobiia bacterium]|nr:hypothetical protein [Acidimicrobiia bacterium]